MVTWAKTSSYYNEWFYEQVPHLKCISSDNNKMFLLPKLSEKFTILPYFVSQWLMNWT